MLENVSWWKSGRWQIEKIIIICRYTHCQFSTRLSFVCGRGRLINVSDDDKNARVKRDEELIALWSQRVRSLAFFSRVLTYSSNRAAIACRWERANFASCRQDFNDFPHAVACYSGGDEGLISYFMVIGFSFFRIVLPFLFLFCVGERREKEYQRCVYEKYELRLASTMSLE